MTAAGVDVRAHVDVIKAALKAAGVDVFEYSDVPTGRKYALMSLERRYVEPRRGGLSGRTGWRLALRYVGGSVFEARSVALFIANALDEKRFAIAGHTSTPLTHESSQAPESDDGKFSGLAVYTYAL